MITVTFQTTTGTVTTALATTVGLDRRDTIENTLVEIEGVYYIGNNAPRDYAVAGTTNYGTITAVTLSPSSDSTEPCKIALADTYGLDEDVIVCLYSEFGCSAIVGGMTYQDALDDAADNSLLARWDVDQNDYDANPDWYTTLGGYGQAFDLSYFKADTFKRSAC